MKKITLFLFLLFYTAISFGQAPCSNISTLGCSQVEVEFPLNLEFNGNQGGILSTGFTMVDAPSSRLISDDIGADPNVPGLKSGNLSLLSGQLNVMATNGINYNQPSSSGNTNSQMNALGVGLTVRTNVVNIEATFAQPDFNSSTPDNKSQQAGIWFGLNENNFIKLVAVDRPGTNAQKFQLALEQNVGGETGSGTTMTIEELNTVNVPTIGGTNITLRISIDPVTNTVTGFYTLDGASEVQVVGPGNSLNVPESFFVGVDHDNNVATNAISFAGIMTSTRSSTGGSLVVSYDNFVVNEEVTPFEAHINFQNNPSFTTPPTGYVSDYGKNFGNASISVGSNNYQFGWKLASDGLTPIDISNEVSNNGGSGASGGAGRNRITGTYNSVSDLEKLQGTLIHFQGDNIISNSGGSQSWLNQPRGNEVIWEIEVPNGTYEVTVGLGDKDANNLDSRHSATLEGYTIIPAFVPTPGQTVIETMIVAVNDGLLTMNGLGGFNSKITHIDIVESTGTPVNSVLSFSPNTISETITVGATGAFSSTLSGSGAANIGLVINDNINVVDKTLTGENDWLTIPTTNTLGQFDFIIDASALAENDTRNDKIIATAKGFKPAELDVDITVESIVVPTVSVPYRMNVAGQDYTKDGNLFVVENTVFLEETVSTTASTSSYTLVGNNDTDLYYPRRYGADFSYNFPIANGEYTVALHMIENFHDAAGNRVFDVEIEGNTLISDLDLVASYGKGVLAIQSYDVVVSDGELNIDFTASANNAILQAIEILPIALNDENEILSFALANETGAATIDDTSKTVSIEVSNGTLLTNLAPTIAVSDDATISPGSGVEQDFTNPINYTVTAEDASEQVWTVTVTEAPSTETDIITFTFAEQTAEATIDEIAHTIVIEVSNGTLVTGLEPTITISDDATISPESGVAQDFTNAVDYTVTAEDGTTTQVWQVTVTEAASTNTAPSITSAATVSVEENQTAVIDVEATDDNDVEGPGLVYSLTGLVDDSLFEIDQVTGVIGFITSPDFENPTDAGADNVYNIQVSLTDSGSLTAVQDIAITVTDIAETTGFAIIEDFDSYGVGNLSEIATSDWSRENESDALIPVLAEGLTPNTTNSLDFSLGGQTHDYIPLDNMPIALVANEPFYFGTYFKVTSANSRVRTALRIDDDLAGDQWIREQVANDGSGGLIARIGLAGAGSDNGNLVVDSDEVFQFVVQGEWDGVDTITYSWTTQPKLNINETVWTAAGTHTVQGTPEIGRLFISSSNTNNAKLGPVRIATDYTAVVTEEINNAPVINEQTFTAVEDLAINSIIGTVVATDSDSANLNYTITAGNIGNAFDVNNSTGEITSLVELDFDSTPQYVLAVEVSDGENTVSADITINITEVIDIEYCSPISTLDCEEIEVSLPLNLDFSSSVENSILENSNQGTGFTMVLENSEARRDGDISVTNPNINGYEASLLSLNSGVLEIQSQGGIAYLNPPASNNNNNQINTLGVGFDGLNESISIKATILNIVTGGSSAQAGIWFGYDEDNFVKLNVNNDNVEIRVESAGLSNASQQVQDNNVGVSGNDVTLELIVNPVALTAEAIYTIGSGSSVSLGSIQIPADYFTGRDINETGLQDNMSFAGIYATHRAGAQFTASFDDFSVHSANVSTATEITAFSFTEETGIATIDDLNNTIAIQVVSGTTLTALTPTIELSSGATISPLSNTSQDFSTPFIYTVTAEDGITSEAWTVTVTEESIPCTPISTLDCDEIEVGLPLALDFTVANGNMSDTGLTMVLEPSARLAADDVIAHSDVSGYAPSLLTQNANGLSITSTKGIFYNQPVGAPRSNNTNSQMNALGAGLVVPSGVFSVSSTLENPDFSVSATNNSQQAGIWFGLDEDHYLKLAILKTGNTSRKVQLQVENMDETTSETAFLEINTGNIASNTGEITLRMELDPINNTVKGYYSFNGGAEILVSDSGGDVLSVPSNYFEGTTFDSANPAKELNFAGVFTTHRNAAEDQSITAIFKDFEIAVEEVALELAFDDSELNFISNVGTTIPSQSTLLSSTSGNPTVIFSDDPDAFEWLVLPSETTVGEVTFSIKENVPAGTYSTRVFAIDDPELGYENAEITINLEVREKQTPLVLGITPSDGTTGVSVNASVSANNLFLPNFDEIGNTGVDNNSINNSTVKIYKEGNTTPIASTANGTGGGDAISIVPSQPLESNTTYVVEIDGVLDVTGEPFAFFTSSFTTGGGGGGPTTDLDNVSFENVGVVASGAKYATLTIGPDGKLYGLEIDGDIHRWGLNADGTLANEQVLNAWKSSYGSRAAIGFAFDPDATATNLIVYITHQSGALNNAPSWDGKISRLTGANLENEDLIVTNLPRSKKDHLTNSIAFKSDEPNVLYFNQGSNSAAGAPDNAWGNRKERLLSASALRLDLDKLPESQWPLNAKTTMDPAAINSVNTGSPTLVSTVSTYTEDGQTYADDGTYNPYYINAPLTLFATGIRNAYDLVWHSNGQLYVPTNGTAGGSNAPASIDGTRRPDGSFYDHSNPLYPIIPASNGNNVQRDWLFRIDPNSTIGFYGHPNPLRGEFVLNRGDADVNNAVYNGVSADVNYRGDAFDFELNKSPNGVIEYRSNAENGNLQGAILVVRYSGGNDIIALVPDGPNGDISTFKVGIPGFTGFNDPLDLIEDVNTGNIYVSDYGSSNIILLKPSNQSTPKAVIVVSNDDFSGDAVSSGTNSYSEEITLSNLGNATLNNITAQITGDDANQFSFSGLPSSIAAQNSGSFDIIFDPTSNGPKFAELTISGTDAEPVIISLSGLGKAGTGGASEPSLQWILNTQLGDGVVNVGDTNTSTNLIDLESGASYNDILGDEVAIQKFERASDAPVTLEVLSVYGPEANNPIVAFGWYESGDVNSVTEIFNIENTTTNNGQTLNPIVNGSLSFDPGIESFGFVSRWPFFSNRQLFSEDILNTFSGAIPHHVRIYELPGEENAYIIATEEHVSGYDYQDIVVIARNIQPFDDTPVEACAPISTLECSELAVSLPFALDFDGTEGGLSNTGFTMVDNPSARIAADGIISNPNVPGYEPSKISVTSGNLNINASNGIAYIINGTGSGTSTDVNSQINTLGVAFNANTIGNFSIQTTLINPYSDGSNDSEQGGLWFGLDEDNFVKLNVSNGGQVELRSEVAGVSGDASKIGATNVTGLHSSNVNLRLFVDVENNLLTAYYTLNNGTEIVVGSLPLPSVYLSGNAAYSNQSFAGVYATKRRELVADVVYVFEDFAITPENQVTFQPVSINFSLPEDVPPTGYLVDSGLGFADRGNSYSYGWLTTNGQTALDLSENARNREVGSVDVLQNTLIHMQYGDVNNGAGTNGVLTEGIWEMAVPNGNYTVSVGVGDPSVDSNSNDIPNHTINVEGINIIDGYTPTGTVGSATRFTSGTTTVTVSDGRLTIDASGGHNTKINSLTILEGGEITEPFFANVTPSHNAVNVAITDFQINVEVVTPVGYELDKTTYAGNVNLYEVTTGGEVLVPSNSNDTGGGDAITLTPLSPLKPFTNYVFRLTSDIEANLVGDTSDRLAFAEFESQFTTGDEDTVAELDLTGVEFTKVPGGIALGDGTSNQRFSSLVIGPDGKLYASTIGNFNSDGKIYRWDMAIDGTLENLEILSPELQGAVHPEDGARANNDRLIIGLAFDPASTAENLIAYVTHSTASVTNGPEWDGILSKLSGPTLSTVEDLIIHLPRSGKDHLTNSIEFDLQGDMFISQGSNTAGGDPDPNWVNRPERLLAGAILKVELDKLPSDLPLSAYTTDNISVINSATSGSLTMSDGSYNPFATNAPLTIFATGVRNAYDLVWHSNGWLYIPTNGTAGNNNNSPNSPSTDDYPLARRIDGLTTIPDVPLLTGGETQKDWLFKTQGGSYHGHPNPYRGEFVLNHGGAPYSGLSGQEEASYTDVAKYPNDLGPDPNYREPAFDFGKNKSPNGAIEYQSNAFGGRLQGLLMVVRFSGQDDILVMQPKSNGDIGNVNGDVPGLGGFDDPLDVIEDPRTGNIYISEYDRDNNGTPKLTLLRATVPATVGPEIAATPDELIFEITVNNEGENSNTKTVSVTNEGTAALNISGATITGEYADQFESVTPSGAISLAPSESQVYSITYAPDLNGSNLGYQEASLVLTSDDEVNPSFEVGLHALKKAGFEGGEEPALQDVVDALGIGVNVGWTSLANGTNPAPSGDESEVELWVKASDAPVNVTPVGRYSPAEELPFGWYTNTEGVVALNEVGVLEGEIENAQTLFPPIVSGDNVFDPLGAVFGFYVDSNSFGRINYSEDGLNAIQPSGVVHRTRIYPMADRDGNPIENSYLIAFEDASNGDYQDYMFIIDNVVPYEDGTLVLDFNKNELSYVAPINQEEIPTQELMLSGNGGVTSSEISLTSSEDWVVLPTSFEINSSFEIGVDITGLSIGSYQATITATASNYQDATIDVNLSVTNELVYVYQFNFQDADDIAVSPQGYIDDLGEPYGVQDTSLGDLTFGWVEPGTLTPANAAVNGRNREGDALLSTFTIIGHNNATNYPQRDWVVNVPNGSYSVNISVGDPDFSDSNHVLDVNGVTIINYNQESTAPDDYGNFEQTNMVEVTDGLLRLSLGAGGANAKPNYIRLAPIDTSLLLPTIVADFDGNSSDENTYRGAVSIELSAIDESESGSIVRLEYMLDDNVLEGYSVPINVVDVGNHVLVVTAEDANGNIAEETFEFTIETPSGALLALENMTKIPGTDRGFPADDYYTFHRLGNPGQAEVHDSNVMRLNNSGTGPLVVTAINISDANDYSYELLDSTGGIATLPLTIETGSYADVDVTFIGGTSTVSNGIFVESIEIISNADNALENKATLHGAYSPQPEGGDEINAQEVFDAFGFESSMLSVVNDEGTITPPNALTYRPSSNYPIAENIDAGYEGDLILSSTFVQADPSKPVIGIQISALHGGPSSNGAKFVEVDGTGTVGGINFSHDGTYYQTLLPRKGDGINFDTATSISGPFRIAISNYLTSGGNNINGNRPDLLGARVYKVIDHNGDVIPNEYIVLQDFVQGGCGAGSANCDWNDNTFYFINIRPEAVPTAQPIDDLLVAINELFSLDTNEYFDKGYPGNILEITATANGEVLPSWINFDSTTGLFEGTPPVGTTGSYSIVLTAEDANGLTALTSFEISISEPPVANDDSYVTEQNVAINLALLDNDSDPNDHLITIVSVESPLNGLAELNEAGTEVLYTPALDYVGSDSFSYTVEDETGLQAIANVSISINEANQAPVAVITTNTIEGPAALYVDFDGSGSSDDNDNIVSYLWNFGDGSGTSTDAVTNYTYNTVGVYQASLTVTDNLSLSHTDYITITVTGVGNTAPNAVASITPIGGVNSLQFNFDGSASNDAESGLTYEWNFGDGSPVLMDQITQHTYEFAGIYTVTLKVTDAGNLMDSFTIDVEAKDEVVNDFALRINAGGPELIHNGDVFAADRDFVGGKVYENTNATVATLYQTERSASPPTFGYDIPLVDGDYEVILHFAEIYWGANGGGAAGEDKRVFDVTMEGNTILDDYDINADVGSQTAVTKTFDVTMSDGILNLVFDASGDDGINQPKLSAIEVVGLRVANELPIADAGEDKTITLPTNNIELVGSGTDSDGTITSYVWTKESGPNGESLNGVNSSTLSVGNLVEGMYIYRLTVTDNMGNVDFDEVSLTVLPEELHYSYALRINAGGSELMHNGELFISDNYFVGGKIYENTQATVSTLYQTERSADPPAFGYDIPLGNGDYKVVLHFAEIYWGANGGGPDGENKRIFDVTLEGNTILDDYDINSDVGAQNEVIKTFDVTISDGMLNLVLEAEGVDGINQPKLSAIEILSNEDIDNQNPVITLNGESYLELNIGDEYVELGVLAIDNIDGDISELVIIGGDIVTTEVEGTYVVTYNVKDSSGNESEEVIRRVEVVDVTEAFNAPDADINLALLDDAVLGGSVNGGRGTM
ncbi:malectin domain-containing carbohydrate-binding protein, partial [Maribacter dokdonensis]